MSEATHPTKIVVSKGKQVRKTMKHATPSEGEIAIYQTKDKKVQFEVRLEGVISDKIRSQRERILRGGWRGEAVKKRPLPDRAG